MSLTTLPLSYCCNVHPTSTVTGLLEILSEKTARVQQLTGQRIAAGLWLPNSVTQELIVSPALIQSVKQKLDEQQLICYTLNAFPFGNFHQERVKEQVYLPDWSTEERRDYTIRCARILAELLPEGVEGSLSTVPLGFKELCSAPDFQAQCCQQLIQLALQLDELHDDTGRVIRLAIEPEPLCVLETTAETIAFFRLLRQMATEQGASAAVTDHIGVCYDICHQAVEYENVQESLQALQAEGIRINKVHITCAVELKNPAENLAGRAALAAFAEPRYLHQTFRQTPTGTVSFTDLTAEFVQTPPADWLQAENWRIHFHVPVHVESLGSLETTQPELKQALTTISQLEYAPHLEVETYTWHVLPGEKPVDLCEGMASEMLSAYELLQSLA